MFNKIICIIHLYQMIVGIIPDNREYLEIDNANNDCNWCK